MAQNKQASLRTSRIVVGIVVVTILLAVVAIVRFTVKPTYIDNLEVTNLTDRHASIIWTTNRFVQSTIEIEKGNSQPGQGTITKIRESCHAGCTAHQLNIPDLESGTEYIIRIKTGLFRKTTDEITIHMPNVTEPSSSPIFVYGRVFNELGEIEENGILVAQIIYEDGSKSNRVSTLLNENSGYSLDISGLVPAGGIAENDYKILLEAISNVDSDELLITLDNAQPAPDMLLLAGVGSLEQFEELANLDFISQIFAKDLFEEEVRYEEKKESSEGELENSLPIENPELSEPGDERESQEPESDDKKDEKKEATCGKTCVTSSICLRKEGVFIDNSCPKKSHVCCDIPEENLPKAPKQEVRGILSCVNDKSLESCDDSMNKCRTLKECPFGCENLGKSSARCIPYDERKEDIMQETEIVIDELSGYYRSVGESEYCALWKTPMSIHQGYGEGTTTHARAMACVVDVTPTEKDNNRDLSYWRETAVSCKQETAANLGNSFFLCQEDGSCLRFSHMTEASGCDPSSSFTTGASGMACQGDECEKWVHLHASIYYPTGEESKKVAMAGASECDTYNICRYVGCWKKEDDQTCEEARPPGIGIILEDNNPLRNFRFTPWRLISKAYAEEISEQVPESNSRNLASRNSSIVTIDQYLNTKKSYTPGEYEVRTADGRQQMVSMQRDSIPMYYDDANRNGQHDSDERILTEEEVGKGNITFNKVLEYLYLDLQSGWNLVAFPYEMGGEKTSKIRKASELLQFIESQGYKATHLSSYRNGVFESYTVRINQGGEEVVFGEDFELKPGEGYFLKSFSQGTVKLTGNKSEMPVELELRDGWNLVGYLSDDGQEITAAELPDIINNSDMSVDVISRWRDGRYNSFIIRDGKTYGYDFVIDESKGYFVRAYKR